MSNEQTRVPVFKSGDPPAIAAANTILKGIDIAYHPITVNDGTGIRFPRRSQVLYVAPEHEQAAREALSIIPTEIILPSHYEAPNKRDRIILWIQLGLGAFIILFSIIMNLING